MTEQTAGEQDEWLAYVHENDPRYASIQEYPRRPGETLLHVSEGKGDQEELALFIAEFHSRSARLATETAAQTKLREQLRWAWNQLGCRCIFDDDHHKTIEDSHCPVHGVYVMPDTYGDVSGNVPTIWQQLEATKQQVRTETAAREQAEREAIATLASWRRSLREAIYAWYPNNPGSSDEELFAAVAEVAQAKNEASPHREFWAREANKSLIKRLEAAEERERKLRALVEDLPTQVYDYPLNEPWVSIDTSSPLLAEWMKRRAALLADAAALEVPNNE